MWILEQVHYEKPGLGGHLYSQMIRWSLGAKMDSLWFDIADGDKILVSLQSSDFPNDSLYSWEQYQGYDNYGLRLGMEEPYTGGVCLRSI